MAAPSQRKGPAQAGPDPQEQRALARAADAVAKFGGGKPDAVAAVAISAWIISRTSQSASARMNADLLFDLKDSRLRGFVEAALPAIGGSLGDLPADVPLFALSKDQIVDVIVAGILGAQEAAVSANEGLGFPFDDEISFPAAPAPLTDEELTH